MMTALPDRNALRAHPLDGAMLFFQPATGLHLRVGSLATAALRRTAPRVVAFGITNRCNLTCSFCSRDVRAPSRWTRATAYEALWELDAAGVLEVAFGGGEPFVFPEFLGLLQDLHAGTRLALNITTNGTRIDEATARVLPGMVGMVRLSIYPDTNWRVAAVNLTAAGVRWGANVLADAASLPTLPALFRELHALGGEDVSILRYVGPDPANHLDEAGLRRLDGFLADSSISARVSVCFGAQLHAPLLFSGADGTGDCGAGRDFLTVTADGAVQACSFQETRIPAPTGAEILRVWRENGGAMGAPSPRRGCARAERIAPRSAGDLSGVRIWRTFSGNNSGECLMVARFAAVKDAKRYLSDLLPGYLPDAAFPPEWRQLLEAEGISSPEVGVAETPQELVGVGRSVIALGYGLDDLFLPLRTLAWKRGAEVAPGGVHVHDQLHLVFAIRGRDGTDADQVLAAVEVPKATARRHGDLVFGVVPVGALSATNAHMKAEGVTGDSAVLARLSAGRPFAVTVLPHEADGAALLGALQRQGDVPEERRRAFIRFRGPSETVEESAARFGAGLDSPVLRVGRSLLVEAPCGKRLAVGASLRGADVEILTTRACHVDIVLSRPDPRARRKPPLVDGAALVVELNQLLRSQGRPREVVVLETRAHYADAWLSVESDEPGTVLRAGAMLAERHGLLLWPRVTDVAPLALALRRLRHEVMESRPGEW
jgi:MoaA/NifB/PqqE/SkfB family radical SAM enzyme